MAQGAMLHKRGGTEDHRNKSGLFRNEKPGSHACPTCMYGSTRCGTSADLYVWWMIFGMSGGWSSTTAARAPSAMEAARMCGLPRSL